VEQAMVVLVPADAFAGAEGFRHAVGARPHRRDDLEEPPMKTVEPSSASTSACSSGSSQVPSSGLYAT